VARERRITILLEADEAILWDEHRNHRFPEGVAARELFLDALEWRANKGVKQRKALHLQKQSTNTQTTDSQEPDYWNEL